MRFIALFLFISIPYFSYSQIENVKRFLQIGISPISYKGDLSHGYEKWNSAFHLGIKNNIKKRFNSSFNLMIGKVTGDNPDYTYSTSTPNQFFTTTIISFNYDLQYNIIKKKNFILYISQGIGLMRFVSKDENNENLSDKFSTRAKNETYSPIALFFPHSIGVMYFLPNNYGVGFQAGRLVPTTDYIDNISKLSSYKKPDNLLMFKLSILAPISLVKKD